MEDRRSPTRRRKPADRPGEAAHPRSEQAAGEEPSFRFEDRRHWAREASAESQEAEPAVRQPTLVDEYRQRAEQAEQKLQEYIEAHKQFKAEQEQVRMRLTRDVDRRVELQFGQLVAELLEAVDNLDLALDHAREVPEAEPLARGVELARKRFLDTLSAHGVEQIRPQGEEFDPNESEAVRVDPVASAEQAGKVTEVLRPGYRLGELVIRAARVAVGHRADT